MYNVAGRGKLIAVRMSDTGLAVVDDLAGLETGGNRSEMIRKLLKEAIEARRGKATPEPSRLAWGKGSYTKGKLEGDDHG